MNDAPPGWTYLRAEWDDGQGSSRTLDALGQDGWELVAVHWQAGRCTGYFKRPPWMQGQEQQGPEAEDQPPPDPEPQAEPHPYPALLPADRPRVQAGDIWLADLPGLPGDHGRFAVSGRRPVVVLTAQEDGAEVVPVTTNLSRTGVLLPRDVGLDKRSLAMTGHLRDLGLRQFHRRLGQVDEDLLKRLGDEAAMSGGQW